MEKAPEPPFARYGKGQLLREGNLRTHYEGVMSLLDFDVINLNVFLLQQAKCIREKNLFRRNTAKLE